jgi:hypothetical protein
MKELEVNNCASISSKSSIEEVSAMLDLLPVREEIGIINWNRFDYKPKVTFAAGYNEDVLFIKFYISENYLKAEKNYTNQMVCEDSCVEFFVSPGDDNTYYNFEFNAIGTCLAGVGSGREDRVLLEDKLISEIRRKSSEGVIPFTEKGGSFEWDLTVMIPVSVFSRHKIESLAGRTMRANFYKCGDKLAVPHYLTWNKIETEKPDFHRPAFFGGIKLV